MIPIDTILTIITESLQIPLEHIQSGTRRPDALDARSVFIYFADKQGHDLQDIIDGAGLTSKSAVPYHIGRVNDLATRDKGMQKAYAKFSAAFKSYKERN